MQYFIRGLPFLFIPIIIVGIFSILRHPKKTEKGKVFLHKFIPIIGTIDTAFFLVPAFITAFTDEPIWVPIVSLLLASLGAILIIAYLNCRITYDDHGFTAKSFFGIKRQYTYEDITAIKTNMHENILYLGKHRVMIDEFALGGIDFIFFCNRKYRKLHNGNKLPRIHKTKHDIFNGNVRDATGFLIGYILVGVCIIAFLIFVVVYVYFMPNTEENTQCSQVYLASCIQKDDTLVMTSSDGETYEIQLFGGDLDTSKIEPVCDGKTLLDVYSKKITPDGEEEYFSVKAIRSNGKDIVGFNEINRLHQQEFFPLIILAGAMNLIWLVYVAFSVIVGRNPQKFSKKFVRLFFKDGYVKYRK